MYKDKTMSKEMRKYIDSFRNYILKESSNKFENNEDIKNTLFELLKLSDGVKRANFIWSTNLIVNAPVLWTDYLDKETFFNVDKNIFDIISDLWHYPEEDYLGKWYKLYYGLVFGYAIYDKKTKLHCLIQVVRWPTDKECEDKKIDKLSFKKQFEIWVNPIYSGEIMGKTIMVDDEIYNIFGIDDSETKPEKPNNSEFVKLAEKLSENVKDLNQIKLIFYYMDSLV